MTYDFCQNNYSKEHGFVFYEPPFLVICIHCGQLRKIHKDGTIEITREIGTIAINPHANDNRIRKTNS